MKNNRGGKMDFKELYGKMEDLYKEMQNKLGDAKNLDERLKIYRPMKESLREMRRTHKHLISELSIDELSNKHKELIKAVEDLNDKINLEIKNTKDVQQKLKLMSISRHLQDELRLLRKNY
jgi:oligoendopeptidase F